jgi:Mn-containing catalase
LAQAAPQLCSFVLIFVDCDGVPFDCSHIYASGNLAADMYCNVAAESTGRTLAVRLSRSDPGMQDMLSSRATRCTSSTGLR